LTRWFANNKERYYHDRIISHVTVLSKFVDPELKIYLHKKNSQYFKSLAANNSRYFFKIFLYCISRRYFDILLKAFIIKFLAQFNIKLRKQKVLKQATSH